MPEENVTIQEEKKSNYESVERITNLPVISTGISLTSGLYSKVKESNPAMRFLFSSAEHTVSKATQLAEPVTNILEKPLKLGDSLVCSTMDLMGNTIPKVVETPQKLYSAAVSSVPVQPAVECVKTVGNYGLQKVNHLYDQLHKSDTQNTQDHIDTQDEKKETEPEKHDQSTQTAMGNVRNKAKMFSQ